MPKEGKMPEWYRVLMFGARDWPYTQPIVRELEGLKSKHGKRLIIITGGASGADSEVAFQARSMDIHVAQVDALWETRGRGAGPQRNTAMLALIPHEGIAFHEDITASKGTNNMRNQLTKAGITVRVVRK